MSMTNTTVLCTHCGTANDTTNKFCMMCGTKIVAPPQETATSSSAGETEVTAPQEQAVFATVEEAAVPQAPAAFAAIEEETEITTGAATEEAALTAQETVVVEPTVVFAPIDTSDQVGIPAQASEEASLETGSRSSFAFGLPEWDILPPDGMIRRV